MISSFHYLPQGAVFDVLINSSPGIHDLLLPQNGHTHFKNLAVLAGIMRYKVKRLSQISQKKQLSVSEVLQKDVEKIGPTFLFFFIWTGLQWAFKELQNSFHWKKW